MQLEITPKVSIKAKNVGDKDDENNSNYDSDKFMGVDDRYPNRKINHNEDYIPSHGGKQYKQGVIHLQTQEKYCDMSDDDKKNYMLGIIMAQYSLKSGLKIFFIKVEKSVTDKLSQLHGMKTFFPVDSKIITK